MPNEVYVNHDDHAGFIIYFDRHQMACADNWNQASSLKTSVVVKHGKGWLILENRQGGFCELICNGGLFATGNRSELEAMIERGRK